MALGTLRREEQIGLALAIVLHVVLIGLFALRPSIQAPARPQPISVTLSPDIGPTATAPTREDAAADIAPMLGTPPPVSVAAPRPVTVEAPPVVKPIARPAPVALAKPPAAAVKQPEPAAPPITAKAVRQKDAPNHLSPAKPAASVKDWNLATPASADHRPAGGSRVGNDFLKGVAGGKASGKAAQQGAALFGPEVKSALSGAIARQLKPHWLAPQGVDADQLVTVLSWDLNADGSLAGAPRVVRQEGVTDSNRPQAARHAEQAIRAVELGAPFKLPAEFYSLWKHVRSFEFNRTLSQ